MGPGPPAVSAMTAVAATTVAAVAPTASRRYGRRRAGAAGAAGARSSAVTAVNSLRAPGVDGPAIRSSCTPVRPATSSSTLDVVTVGSLRGGRTPRGRSAPDRRRRPAARGRSVCGRGAAGCSPRCASSRVPRRSRRCPGPPRRPARAVPGPRPAGPGTPRREPTVTTSRVDELVAGLTGVHDDRIAGPSTPGARRLLTAVTAEERAPAAPAAPARRRPYRRLADGATAATEVAATAVIALTAGGPGPIRSYANAAVDIQRTNGTYRVHIKNVYADQRQFHQAFAKFGLDVTLSIVPVAPCRERRIVGGGGDAIGTISTVLKCPPGLGTACPLTVELSGPEILSLIHNSE